MKKPSDKHTSHSYQSHNHGAKPAHHDTRISGTYSRKKDAFLHHDQGADASAFTCKKCGQLVLPQGAGTQHRNHCPLCLFSIHVDNRPGDRAARCGQLMEPIGVWVRKGGEWALIHRCRSCGALSSNRIAADDNALLLMSLAIRPLSTPPFPLEYLLAETGIGD